MVLLFGMIYWFVFGYLVVCLLLVVAGRIILAAFPTTFGATTINLFLFVVGGFVGMFTFPGLFALTIPAIQNINYVMLPLIIVGALTGGTGFVWLKQRLTNSRRFN